MTDDTSDKVPQIKVSSAYPGEWYVVEVDGGDGALWMELRRPVGDEDADGFHLRIATPIQTFDVQSAKDGATSHSHQGVSSVQLAFTGPTTVWPDFVRCIQAIASVFDTLATTPLDRDKVREHFFKNKK